MSIHSNIFLIGYRGTGKTTVARHLAELRGWSWVDSDDHVEQHAGKTIAEIFADDGEPYFRDQEEKVIEELCKGQGRVVALGGGAVLRPETRKRLAAACDIVWLTAQPATLAARINDDESSADRRPSLSEKGLLEEIEQVLAQRTPIYQKCATLVIDTEEKSPAQVAEEIDRKLP